MTKKWNGSHSLTLWNKCIKILILFLQSHIWSIIKFRTSHIFVGSKQWDHSLSVLSSLRGILIKIGQHQIWDFEFQKVNFKHLLLIFTYSIMKLKNLVWWKVLKGSLFAWVFSLARISRLVRRSSVRTQEEFQYRKILSFLLSSCERISALSQYKTPQQHAIKKKIPWKKDRKKHLSSPRLFNDKQQCSGTQ